MAVDREIVQARLAVIEDNLRLLRELPQSTFDEFTADFRNPEAAKYLLQTAVEAMVDVCTHVVARLRLRVPGNSAEVVRAMGRAGLLPPDHVARFANMIRFRNVLVHLYAEVDDRKVYEILRNELGDFELFVADAWRIANDEAAGRP